MELSQLTAYQIIERKELPDISATQILLQHKKSGARVLVIPCADTNKVFSIGFRTPPADSTGVAHIIEHSVLCGSDKFPIKDPFIELASGSLNTFINAITFGDKTVYPIASTNQKDFRNLTDVYMDAVLHPSIYKTDKIFKQEGWSYRLDNADAPLVCNGVVYNEMKGAFSSPDEVISREICNSLFPDTPYGVESGGDPDHIPDLTYEQFIAFHQRYYHPSNSYIYLYGDMDVAESLTWLDEAYLNGYDRLDIDSHIPYQAPFTQMASKTIAYPLADSDSEDDNTYLCWNVVTGDYADISRQLAVSVLRVALIDAPGAPLKQALLDKHIGKDIYGSSNDEILQPYFGITAKNANAADAPEFTKTIYDTLRQLASSGLNHKALTGILNVMEFNFRQADFGRLPKGLMYNFLALQSWLYDDAKPTLYLQPLAVYADLRRKIDENYFEDLISQLLVSNNHAAVLVAVGQKGLAALRQQESEAALARRKAALTPAEISQLVEQTRQLKEFQETPDTAQALASIPRLQRSDIGTAAPQMANAVSESLIGGHKIETLFHSVAGNGIGYIDLAFDAAAADSADLPYIGLLTEVLGYVDTDDYRYTDLFNEINIVTGGIDTHYDLFTDLTAEKPYIAKYTVSLKAMISQLDKAVPLVMQIIGHSRFDDAKRLHEIISQCRSQLESRLTNNGDYAASQRASAYLNAKAAAADATGGISYYRFLKDLETNFDSRSQQLSDRLAKLAGQFFTLDHLMINYSCADADQPAVAKQFETSLTDLPSLPSKPDCYIKPLGRLNEGLKTSGTIQYVTATGQFSQPFTGALTILTTILTLDYLWTNLRVKGGAYGCSARFTMDGQGCFTSYRDPNLRNTFEVYQNVVAYLQQFSATEEEMTKFVIGTIGNLDTPMTPSMFNRWCFGNYLSHHTQQQIQQTRDQILAAQPADIQALADCMQQILDCDCRCVIGSAAAIDKDKDLFAVTADLL